MNTHNDTPDNSLPARAGLPKFETKQELPVPPAEELIKPSVKVLAAIFYKEQCVGFVELDANNLPSLTIEHSGWRQLEGELNSAITRGESIIGRNRKECSLSTLEGITQALHSVSRGLLVVKPVDAKSNTSQTDD